VFDCVVVITDRQVLDRQLQDAIYQIEDNPKFPKKKAPRALARFMRLHPHNLEQKTEVMVEHFRQKVMGHLGGRAKAMVVTSSRLHAVRYMQAFEWYLAENKYTDIRPLVAFSGTVRDPDTGAEYTEPGMNPDCVTGRPISEKQLVMQAPQDHASMQLHLQPAVDRFKAVADEVKRSEFREKPNGYVRLYGFLSQIMPYNDPALEMLSSFGRFLVPRLPLDRDTERVKVGDEVGVQYYRLQRIYSGGIELKDGEPEGVKSPTAVGTGRAKEDEDLMVQRMADNDKIVTRYMEDKEFGSAAYAVLSKAIYDSIAPVGETDRSAPITGAQR